MTRIEGMQAQITPTLISIVDQFVTSSWSQVGFVELAKWTRDWSRRIETIVTLQEGFSVEIYNAVVWGHLQGTNKEHQGNADLLFPGEL